MRLKARRGKKDDGRSSRRQERRHAVEPTLRGQDALWRALPGSRRARKETLPDARRRARRGRAPRQRECIDAWPIHARGHRGTSPIAGLAAAIAQADATDRMSRRSRKQSPFGWGAGATLRRFTVDRFIKGSAEAAGVDRRSFRVFQPGDAPRRRARAEDGWRCSGANPAGGRVETRWPRPTDPRVALEQAPKKLTDTSDGNFLQLYDLERFPVARVIPCERKASGLRFLGERRGPRRVAPPKVRPVPARFSPKLWPSTKPMRRWR